MPLSTNRPNHAFSLLELIMAITIFAMASGVLYTLSDAMLRLNNNSLGLQRFKGEAIAILDRIEEEVSEAVVGLNYVRGLEGSPTPPTAPMAQFTFLCTGRANNPTNSREFNGSNPDPLNDPVFNYTSHNQTQQLFWTILEERFIQDEDGAGTVTDMRGIRDILRQAEDRLASEVTWNKILLKEKILYMTNAVLDGENNFRLQLFSREEDPVDPFGIANPANLLTPRVDGEPNNHTTVASGNYALRPRLRNGRFDNTQLPPTYSPRINDIQYLFWGDNNLDWYDDGTGNPILGWDSRDNANPNHGEDELPHAMKVILTMTYNPDIYSKRWQDRNVARDQVLIFEKVIPFRNRRS